jgi:hypothetical protein
LPRLQDLPNALPVDVIADKLGLASLKQRQWQIFKTSAIKASPFNHSAPRLSASSRALGTALCLSGRRTRAARPHRTRRSLF